MPVPRPTHAAVSPPARAAAMAADGVVLPMPISPTTSRSPSRRSTAATAMSTISSKRSGRQRRLEADVVRRPADADVDGVDRGAGLAGEGADRRAALAVGVEHRRRDVRRVGADGLGRGDAVVAGEDQPDRAVDAWPVGAVPAGDPLGQLVEPGQRAARAEDLGRPLVDGGRRRLVGARQVDEQVVQARHAQARPGVGERRARGRRRGAGAVSATAAHCWLTRPRRSR